MFWILVFSCPKMTLITIFTRMTHAPKSPIFSMSHKFLVYHCWLPGVRFEVVPFILMFIFYFTMSQNKKVGFNLITFDQCCSHRCQANLIWTRMTSWKLKRLLIENQGQAPMQKINTKTWTSLCVPSSSTGLGCYHWICICISIEAAAIELPSSSSTGRALLSLMPSHSASDKSDVADLLCQHLYIQ